MGSEEITTSFYENEVPPFVETEMERLYGNIYASPVRLRIYGEIGNASTYVVRKCSKVITVFLFRREREEVKVLNQQIKIGEEEVCRFVNAIFAAFKSVTVISFYAIQTAIRRIPFPHQRGYCLSEVVLSLPGTEKKYLDSLGRSTRQNTRHDMKKLERSFPSLCYEVYAKEEVNEQHIRDIIRLSSARMVVKNKVSFHNEESTERYICLARAYGFVVVATIDGRVCAGTICSRIGTNYFLHVIGHDPEYDAYGLGHLCCYRTICECISQGGKEFRFGGSTHAYKFNFLGVWLGFDRLTVYRSLAHFVRDGGRVLTMSFRAYALRARVWLLLAERRDDFLPRVATGFVHILRNMKRFRYGLLGARK